MDIIACEIAGGLSRAQSSLMKSEPDSAPKMLVIEAEFTRLLYTQESAGFWATLINIAILTAVLWSVLPTMRVLTWCVITVVITGALPSRVSARAMHANGRPRGALAARALHPTLPIIIYSGSPVELPETLSPARGDTIYLKTPFTMEQLGQALQQLFRSEEEVRL